MITLNDKDLKEYERDLKTFAKRAFPFATKATLNGAAFTTQKISKAQLSADLTLRNRFTLQSIRVEQTRTLDVRRQASIVGSTADYMERQEFGGIKVKTGNEGIPIATAYSAGQGQGSRPRTRLPRKANLMQNIALQRRRNKGTTRRQRNLIAIKQAATSGRKFVFLDLSRRRGIFRVVGGKTRPKIKMVWDMSRKSVVIPRNPWLAPAVKLTERRMPGIYKEALRFQLKRHNLFDR